MHVPVCKHLVNCGTAQCASAGADVARLNKLGVGASRESAAPPQALAARL